MPKKSDKKHKKIAKKGYYLSCCHKKILNMSNVGLFKGSN